MLKGPPTVTATGALLAAAICACGASASRSSTTDTSTAASTPPTPTTSSDAAPASPQATVAEKVPLDNINITTSVNKSPLPARYTCDGANISPPLSWNNVPPGTRELDVVLAHATPSGKIVTDWALTGLPPSLRSIAAGKTPHGAIVGRSSNGRHGYHLCPARGASQEYVVAVFALPHTIHVTSGFDGVALRKRALNASLSEGLLPIIYKRR